MTDTERERINAICEVAGVAEIDDLSDGFHTFRQLYYQRMMLFATIVKQNKDKAWKSLRHENGELCFGGGWFIVGIDTPEGSYTYHYEDNYYSLFDCEELERGKHWDGHTEKDVTRLLSLSKAQLSQQGTTKNTTSELISRMETVEHLRRVLEATVPNTDYDEGYIDGIEFGISTVSTMPTIQSQSTTGQLNDGAQSTAQSTDLIDRQAVLDAVEKNACNTQRIMDAVNNLPTIQPEPQWIPVSERLPSKEEYKEWIDNNLDGIGYLYPCLVTRYSSINPDRTKNNPYVAKHYFDGEDFLNAGEEVCSEYIIAWMPLPEAYKPNK